MTHQFHPTVLREYDIRGIIGETLGECRCLCDRSRLCDAAAPAGGRKVAVGYDGRLSSPMLEEALVEGLTIAGSMPCGSAWGPPRCSIMPKPQPKMCRAAFR
jgi:phosphomannomutase